MSADIADSGSGHIACDLADVPVGSRVVKQLGRVSVGIFNIQGQILAIRNLCPHAGAPVCEGPICGAVVSDGSYERHLAYDGQILKCPWHGWEFKLPEGVTLTEPHERLRMYPVRVENGKVIVQTEARPRRVPAGASAAGPAQSGSRA